MKAYRTKSGKLPGTRYAEVYKKAFQLYKPIKAKTKRRPYVRSAYFKKEKIFLESFWQHARQKNPRDRMRRLKFFNCALELIKNSRYEPTSDINRKKRIEILHKFGGITKEGELFYVQIKENKKTGAKYFMSCFPEK